ncbi:hypothetical protein BJ944DRAFT_168198 [Cunninghamella echinulata]|nr:hypothetical protein BJ944DRAFT_168198 [Cunninghamella echinulata]
MSTTMKAIVVEENGDVDKLIYKDVELPKAGQGEIVIKNHSIGINMIDTYHLKGIYKLPLPFILGRESAGEISEVGEGVTGFKIGDRVAHMGGSGYAEYTKTNLSTVGKLPDSISYDTATAALLQGLTAITMVKDGYPVKKGDYVLIHAAAGGVGLLLTQLCNHLGATVIGTASTQAKCELAKENGAHHTINYSEEDVVEKVNGITNGLGCHAILDGVGQSTFETSLACVRRLGTFISFGNASGVIPPFSIALLAQKNIKLMRPTLYNYLATPEEFTKWYNELMTYVDQNVLKFRIHKVYDLKDAAQALQDIQGRVTTGKLILRP